MFILGDIHGDMKLISYFINESKEKYCVQLGDFGVIFSETPTPKETLVLDYINSKLLETDKTVFTILGNHECWPRYFEMPVVTVCGAKCWQIRERILAVQPGEILEIEGKKCLCIGGADSHDIEWRIGYQEANGTVIWWKEESITEDDYNNAIRNYKEKVGEGNKIDFVFTHTPPSIIVRKMLMTFHFRFDIRFPTNSEALLQRLYDGDDVNLVFGEWFCGHMHDHYVDQHDNKNVEVLAIEDVAVR